MRLINADKLKTSLNETVDAAIKWHEDCLGEIMQNRSEATITALVECILRVKEQPTIDAVEVVRWIPCSERLPDEFGEYLVTKKAIGWNCEEYNSNDIAYFDNEGFHKAEDVLAWMPLPEPWKGEEP